MFRKDMAMRDRLILVASPPLLRRDRVPNRFKRTRALRRRSVPFLACSNCACVGPAGIGQVVTTGAVLRLPLRHTPRHGESPLEQIRPA